MNTKIKLFEAAQQVYAPDMFTNIGDNMRHNEINSIGTINVPDSTYHNIHEFGGKPVVSQTGLKRFNEDPEKWKANLPFNKSRIVVLGSLLDTAVLNHKDIGKYIFLSGKEGDGRTKEGKSAKINAYMSGKEVVSESEIKEIFANIEKLQQCPKAKELMSGASTQIQMLDTRKDIGLRGMLDIVPNANGRFGDGLADMKRTGQFLPPQWKKHIYSMSYHWQAALYLDLWNAICDAHNMSTQKRTEWYFLICASEAPFGCGVNKLSQELIKRGREGYMNALAQYGECLRTGEYNNPWNIGEISVMKAYGEE